MSTLSIVILVGLASLLIFVLIARALPSFLVRRAFAKFSKSQVHGDPRSLENPKYGTLVATSESLSLTSGTGEMSALHWSEVEEIHAYKRDLFTTDLICIAFKKSGQEDSYEIHEEMAGYYNLLEELPRHFPEFTLDWVFEVPAFQTKHQIIWRRSPD